ncbi:coxsackievirus and adenovirus receptor homolog isoform X4 [Scyliorhinus torazame]|uniref:coxsackievirus and adenovirus receptor homolog isoform X4 n=1 Tax=Scyliorhinus torazame TaxID=75743 RepID=UPI003B5B039F
MDSGRSGPATLILLSLVAGWSQGLEILSAPENVQAGDGDSVMLPCQFRVTNADIGPLDIEWSRTPTNLVDSPLIIIDYSGDRVYESQLEDMKGRVHFSSSDPKTGDASLNITRLKSTDSGRYHCKVKKSPGSKTISIKLSVLVRPSKPMCSVEGSQEIGKDVILKCSSEGTPPITYFWTREGSSMPSTAVADITQGTLKVKNATEAYSGNYKCVARNQIDSSQCFAKLAITSSSNNAGRTAGIVIAVLLFLLILAIIIWCLFWRKKKKTYEKEQSYEIRKRGNGQKRSPRAITPWSSCEEVAPDWKITHYGGMVQTLWPGIYKSCRGCMRNGNICFLMIITSQSVLYNCNIEW